MKHDDRDEELELLKRQLAEMSQKLEAIEKGEGATDSADRVEELAKPVEVAPAGKVDPGEQSVAPSYIPKLDHEKEGLEPLNSKTPSDTVGNAGDISNVQDGESRSFVKPALLQRLANSNRTDHVSHGSGGIDTRQKSVESEQPSTAPLPPPPMPAAASFRPVDSTAADQRTWEWRVATVWFPRIAIAVLGLVLITIAREYTTGLWARMIFGYMISGALLAAGTWREKRYPTWAIPLIAAGLAFSYFTTFAIGFVPAMKLVNSEPLAYGLLAINFMAILGVAQKKGSEVIAVIAVVLGFFTTGAASGDHVGHVSILLLTLMTAVLFVVNKWRILMLVGVFFTYAAQYYLQRFNNINLVPVPVGSLMKQVWLLGGYFCAYSIALLVARLDPAPVKKPGTIETSASPEKVNSSITWLNNIMFFGAMVLTFSWFEASKNTISFIFAIVTFTSFAMAAMHFKRTVLATPWVFLALLSAIYTGVQFLSPHVFMTALMLLACGVLWAAKRMNEPGLAFVTPVIFFYVLLQMIGIQPFTLGYKLEHISEWWLLPPLIAGLVYCVWWHHLLEQGPERTLIFTSFLGIALVVATFPQFILFPTPEKYLVVLGGLLITAGLLGTYLKWPGSVGVVSTVAIAAVFPFVQPGSAGHQFPLVTVVILGIIMTTVGILYERRSTGHISLDHTGYRFSYMVGVGLAGFALARGSVDLTTAWLLLIMAVTLVAGKYLRSLSLQLAGAMVWAVFLYLVVFKYADLGDNWLILVAAGSVGVHTLMITGLVPARTDTATRSSEIKFLGLMGIGVALLLAFSLIDKQDAMVGVVACGFVALGGALLGRWLRAGFIASYSPVIGAGAFLYFMIGVGLTPRSPWWQELMAAGVCSVLLLLAERVLAYGTEPGKNMDDPERVKSIAGWQFASSELGLTCRAALMGESVLLIILALFQTNMPNLYVTVVLMLISFVWLVTGLLTRDALYRQVGFYMMLFCLGKMFIYDVSQLKNINARVAGWGVAALLLILVSLLYTRKPQARGAVKQESPDQ